MPDIALDIIDEAASEYHVKKEFSSVKVPILEKQIADVEALIKKCGGKKTKASEEDLQQLETLYKEFTQNMERLEGFWGHRLEIQSGVDQ